MDIRYIESFLVLSELLNFSKASRKVCISQSAFSRQIAALENEFGCSLFIRDKRSVELSDAGREFLPRAGRIVTEYREWQESLRNGSTGDSDTLKIGFLIDLPAEIISRGVRRFKTARPDAALSFYDRSLTEIIVGLIEDDFDCAFTLTAENEVFPDFDSIRLCSYPLCAVFPLSHPLAGRRSIGLSELKNEELISVERRHYTPGSRQIETLCAEAGVVPGKSNAVSSVPSLLSMVEFGMGVGLVSSAAEAMGHPNISFVPLREKGALCHLVLLWKKCNGKALLLPFSESLRDLVRSCTDIREWTPIH